MQTCGGCVTAVQDRARDVVRLQLAHRLGPFVDRLLRRGVADVLAKLGRDEAGLDRP